MVADRVLVIHEQRGVFGQVAAHAYTQFGSLPPIWLPPLQSPRVGREPGGREVSAIYGVRQVIGSGPKIGRGRRDVPTEQTCQRRIDELESRVAGLVAQLAQLAQRDATIAALQRLEPQDVRTQTGRGSLWVEARISSSDGRRIGSDCLGSGFQVFILPEGTYIAPSMRKAATSMAPFAVRINPTSHG